MTTLPVARSRMMHSHRRGEMNRTEALYEKEVLGPRLLTGEIAYYWFESVTFKLGDNTRYTPDFVVQFPDGSFECHEVKGTKRDKATGESKPYIADGVSRVKVAVAADQWPFRFVIVWRDGKNGWMQRVVGGPGLEGEGG